MPASKKYLSFSGQIFIIGFGSIGQAVLPLILRHIEIAPSQIRIITKKADGEEVAKSYGVDLQVAALTQTNYQDILNACLQAGDFLLNLSVDVSSLDLIQFCQNKEVLYLDTCIEPWVGGYTDPTLSSAMRTNYALREAALKLKSQGLKSTALITHGANPGLVSHFVKQALLNIAADIGLDVAIPKNKDEWARLAKQLSIKTIQIAERDTQVAAQAKRVGEFVNTWSVDGFVAEGSQPAELGWGTHERHWPHDAHQHTAGCQSAIYLERPGASTRVRTWTPLAGSFHGFLITHGESISIADYLTVKNNSTVHYRPTVHYAYHPCDDAVLSLHELAGREWSQQDRQRLIFDEIVAGVDELGVLLTGHTKGAYWFGSQLTVHEARELAPYNNATSLQVAVSVLAGMIWAMEHPQEGLVEPDEVDFQYILNIADPYLGKVVGEYTDWTPLTDRENLFTENLDREDPWQFLNVRVM